MSIIYVVTRHGSGSATIGAFTDESFADSLCAAYAEAFDALGDASYEVEACTLDEPQAELDALAELIEDEDG